MLNLARCDEQSGKIASALRGYDRAAGLAEAAGNMDRAKASRELAVALRKRVATIRIRMDTQTPGAKFFDNGAEIEASLLGVPMPVDPGEHKIEATAPGFQTWSATIKIEREAQQEQVLVPALEPGVEPSASAPTAAPSAAPPPSATAAPTAPVASTAPKPEPVASALPPPPPPHEGASGTNAVGIAGYVLIGLGGASVVVGAGFAIDSLSAKSAFNDGPTTQIADRGERDTLLADVFFGAGIVCAVTGVVLAVVGSGHESEGADAPRSAFIPKILGQRGGSAVGWSF